MFVRVVDALQAAEQARDAGMKAIVLKNHHEGSMGKATIVKRVVEEVEVFGSIVLNYAAGGLNPFAVDSAIKLGAKIIFMPTVDARNHIQFYGVGQYGKKMQLTSALPKAYEHVQGITILKDDDELDPAVAEILEMIADADVALATCHLSIPELKRLVSEAIKTGVKKVIVSHVNFEVPNIPIEDQIQLAEMGAHIEHAFMSMLPPWQCLNVDQMADRIRRVGPKHCILSSDCGKITGPTPVEGLRMLYRLLLEGGISENEIELMSQTNPSKLLNI
jgi:hypothetical protein